MVARMPPHDAPGRTRGLAGRLTDVTAAVCQALRIQGIDDPRREARRLVAAIMKFDPIVFITEPDREITERQGTQLEAALERRLAGEPVSRILGMREFYGREFVLSAQTLDPRPDTETLVELAIELVRKEGWESRPVRILDMGTGTGCIAITLLCELPRASAVATDISQDALETARNNAERHDVADRISFAISDGLDDVHGTFDLLVSNPPYIPTGDIAGLETEVRRFDPKAALDGGPDGLDFYRMLAATVPKVVPDGWVVVEVGAGQAAEVASLFSAFASTDVQTKVDLAGHTRCVAFRTRNS